MLPLFTFSNVPVTSNLCTITFTGLSMSITESIIAICPLSLCPLSGAARGLSEAAISKRNKVVVDNNKKKKNKTKCFSSLRNAGTI